MSTPRPMTTWGQRADGKRLLILGEAPGEREERLGRPFIGGSGDLLRTDLMPIAGLRLEDWTITNVFSKRPPQGLLKQHWTLNATEIKKAGYAPRLPKYQKRFFIPSAWEQIDATRQWILDYNPDFTIAFGGAALWLLTGDERISLFRGSMLATPYGPAIATYHPAAILREWAMRPFVWADLKKAAQHLEGTLPPSVARRLYYSPTEEEIQFVYDQFKANPTRQLGVDIETAPSVGQMTTISYAWPELAICLPIWDKDSAAPILTPEAELRQWRWIERFAHLPNPKVLQNGMYDMQYLLDGPLAIRLAGTIDDTAIMAHATQPELPKDLGTLGSLHLQEPSWKQMRTSLKDIKAED